MSAWKKGMPSPNPAGRPPIGTSLADKIRSRIGADKLVDVAQSILEGRPLYRFLDAPRGIPLAGEDVPEGAKITEVIWPTVAERLKALEWLADRAYPQPKTVDLTMRRGEDEVARRTDTRRLSPEERDQLIALHTKALGGDEAAQAAIDVVSGTKKD